MPEPVAQTKKYNAVVIVTSDSCFEDNARDESGPYVVDQLQSTQLFLNVHKLITNDDMDRIVKCLEDSLENYDPALIITIGGTGMCPRDVTPEATSSLYDKVTSGLTHAIHMNSLRFKPHAALSRLTSGIVAGTLIINFPGKLKACKECFSCIELLLEHALEQVRFDFVAYSATHRRQQRQDTARKHVPRSPTGHCVELSVSSSSLTSLNSNTKVRPTKKIAQKPNGHPRSRSSSQISMHTLTIEEVEESRQDIASLEIERASDFGSSLSVAHKPAQTNPKRQFYKQKSHGSNTSLNATPRAQHQPRQQQQQQHPNQKQLAKPRPLPPPPVQLPPVKILQNHSEYPLIQFDESLRILASLSTGLYSKPETVILTNFSIAYKCIGSTLAEDLISKRIVPPYAVSTMDGYVLNVHPALKEAISQVKTIPSVLIVPSLKVFEDYQKTREKEQKFFCYQVNTGGRLPRFNYAVIPVEKTDRVDEDHVCIKEVRQNLYVRKAASDIGEQDVIKAGTLIGSVELTSIIAMGHKTLKVLHRPTLGVLSTGDEVQDFFSNEVINQDSVPDLNAPLLQAMFRSMGYYVEFGGLAKDDPSDLFYKIGDILKKCDVLLITGGASMGTRDHVKDVIHHMGGKIHFGRVNIKPGKPVAFASMLVDDKHKFVFSLPGNPVSAFVTSLIMVNPFLKHGPESFLSSQKQLIEHLGETILAKVEVIEDMTGREVHRFDGRYEFLRARISHRKMEYVENKPVYFVKVSVKQQSSRLLGLLDCDCLMMVDPSKKGQVLQEGLIYPALKLNRKF